MRLEMTLTFWCVLTTSRKPRPTPCSQARPIADNPSEQCNATKCTCYYYTPTIGFAALEKKGRLQLFIFSDPALNYGFACSRCSRLW